MKYGSFDKRMKKYEYVTRNYLTTRTPVIIRIDGKAFHTFTKGFQKPFDAVLSNAMQMTMKYLCENIQGCVLGYTQSDEITLVLIDYKKIDSSPWFDYNIQKCASVSASMATMAFNKFFDLEICKYDAQWKCSLTPKSIEVQQAHQDYIGKLRLAIDKGAMFDARVFNIPKEEVCNNILWRQNDATRNSIEMVGQAYFSHKELHKKKCNEIQDMLMLQKGINWNNYLTRYKRGSCCIRKADETTGRSKWIIDNEIPIFKSNGRKYIDNLIYIG
ncbi:MAG: tRNA(His) guanylyltransferase Thg1 family protein [Bacteroidales bacterium]|nr:tRNA(His) guanylyltransferase Thg1 family protein [Bacteroidales bacterium]